jgi:ABC-2 type transport system permease protein
MRTLLFLLQKEALQVVRDRTMLRMLVALPIIQLLLLSSAATFEVRRAPLWVVDQDHSAVSRGLVQRLAASGRFRVAGSSASMEPAERAMLDGRVSVILRLPAGLERELVRTGAAPVQLVFDAQDGAAAGVLQSYAAGVLARYAGELESELRPGRPGPAPGRIELRTRGWYNPALRYHDYMVPGILVVLVTVIATAVASMNIVREKELGTLEQLNVTPLGRWQFIAGKLIPFWVVALADLALGLAVARLAFGVPVRGSLLLIFGAAAVYLVAALGIGLWVSTVARTQQQAMFVSFAITLVYLLMSGLFTPVASMPPWAQWLAEASPVKHFIVIMRAVLVKGAGFADVRLPLAVLAAYGAAVLALAVRQHAKTSAG